MKIIYSSKLQDGTVLHCFNWKYTDIIAELPNIAAAGFTTVQTSPAQVGAGTGAWYWLYQPLGFYVGSNGIGTEAELKTLCTEAHKYGMKVIVDVVANHLAGNHSSIQNDLKGSEYWHYYGSQIDYKNRYAVVNGDIGMQDLNSENSYVQQVVANYIKSLKNDGVDGIRWDAAKHIALPSEGCNFWPAVTSEGLFNYGEILVGPTDDEQNSNNTPLMQEYTNYMTVTDSIYGKTLREAFKNGNITSSIGNWSERGVSKSKLIYWAESHDTYSNNGEYGEDSRTSNQNQIDRAYAILAAQANAMTLYFSRPFQTIKNNIKIGVKGSTAFKSDEIAAVNHFHNAMIGQKEYYTTGDNCAVVCREQGAVVVKGSGSGDVTVPNGGGTTAPGTYVDQVSGSTWTVTSTTISGTIGSSGIAVIYNPGPVVTEPTASITPGSQNYSTDSISLTLNFKNATSGSYSIDNGTYKTFTNGQTITIGTGLAYGTSTKVSVKATDGTTTSTPVSYTYTKTETVENTAYLKLPAGWGTDVYCYAYDSATELVNNGVWPGKKMTLDASTGYYKYVVPDTIKAPRVIFYNSYANRTPVDKVKGYLFETDGSWLYADGTWAKYQPVATGTVKVNYLDESGTSIATAKTLTGTVGETYTTTAVAVEGYTLKSTPTNASGKYTSGTITVNYVYSVVTDDTPKVTSSLATNSTFKTETQTIKLTLANAVSGTYTVDDGPTKSFTGTANVVLGQGKVADSVVTVKATATNSTGTTKSYTFTYNKEFNGTVNEAEKVVSAEKYLLSASNLASQYSTNKAGTGVNKTITVDGSIADWNSSMIIAQGAANDDPRVYRDNSMYEIPIDMYTLYGAWDDDNLYLMWEMTNVQDVVAPNDNYPLSQGILFQTMNVPFFLAIDTGDTSTRIGNSGMTSANETIWGSNITIESNFNKLIAVSTNGANGPFLYGGTSAGLNTVEEYTAKTSGITYKYGLGILSSEVKGINGAYGINNNRVVGDISSDSADWVEFNSKGHSSSTMDFHYEMSIPFSTLGVTASDVSSKGLGVLVVSTMGMSGMDCLPYDTAMNDNADLADTESQAFNSFEKSDADNITTSFARVAGSGGGLTDDLELNFGADKSSPQTAETALTLNGIAEGGKAPYTYKYYVNGSLVGTKSGSGATSVAWTPSAGNYVIKCEVTDAENTVTTSTKNYTVESGGTTALSAKLTVNNSTSNFNVNVGASVTLKASATGGSGSYTYTYKAYDGSKWLTLKSNTTSRTYTTSAGTSGSMKYVVVVKDSTGKTVDSNKITVTIIDEELVGTLKINNSTSNQTVNSGSSIILTTSASGGSGSYSYTYKAYNGSKWLTLKSNTTSTTYTTSAGTNGSMKYVVVVKDSTGKTVDSNKITITIIDKELTGTLKVNGLTSNQTVSAGSIVILKASATGGSANYTYTYKAYDGSKWLTLKSNTTSTTYTTTAGTSGSMKYVVVVKDSTGKTVDSNKITLTIANKELAGTMKINNSSYDAIMEEGSTITIAVNAEGGSGSYTYTYKAYDGKKWITLKSATSSTSYICKVTTSMRYVVVVKDSTGKTIDSNKIQIIV